MDNEYEILSHLEKHQDTSQRKIANKTGLSVGTVNFLLKKMVRKGLVKIERLNAKTLRYIITPYGMAEKTRLVYQYIKSSYNQIVRMTDALSQIMACDEPLAGTREVIFYGPPDEILEILKIAAGNLDLRYRVVSKNSDLMKHMEDLFSLPGNDVDGKQDQAVLNKPVIIVWSNENADKLPHNIKAVNILKEI